MTSDSHTRMPRFDAEYLGRPQPWKVEHGGLEYNGEFVVSEIVTDDLFAPLNHDVSFRVVFFTRDRRPSITEQLDSRIIMVVPVRPAVDDFNQVGDRLRSLMGTLDSSQNLSGIREAIEQNVDTAILEMPLQLKNGYARGRVYTSTNSRINVADVFANDSPGKWIDSFAADALWSTYPNRPFDYESFPRTLTDSDVHQIIRGLLQGDSGASALVTAFGPGLGLTSTDAPTVLDTENCRAFPIIRQFLEDRGGQASSPDLIESLVRDHGLSSSVSALYLLAFVRSECAQIELQQGHNVQTLSGDPYAGDSITWDFLADIDMDIDLSAPSFVDSWQTVRLEPSASWDMVLPYAVLIDSEAQTSTDQSDAAQQESRILALLDAMKLSLTDNLQSLQTLEEQFNTSFDDLRDQLTSLTSLCGASGIVDFYSIASETFAGTKRLRDALESHAQLDRAAASVPELLAARDYLGQVTFGRDGGALALDRDALNARFDANSLLQSQSAREGLRSNINQFKDSYSLDYLAHHTSYHQRGLELRNRLERLRPQVDAIGLFNGIPEFGEPISPEAPELFGNVESGFRECALAESEVSLENAPYCSECEISLADDIPERDSELLVGQVEHAMREINRRFGTMSARRVLSHPSKEQLDKFIALVQVADSSALVNVLDAEVIEFLRDYLKGS